MSASPSFEGGRDNEEHSVADSDDDPSDSGSDYTGTGDSSDGESMHGRDHGEESAESDGAESDSDSAYTSEGESSSDSEGARPAPVRGKSWGAIVVELLRDSPGEAMSWSQINSLLGVVQAGPPMKRIREAQAKMYADKGNVDGGVTYNGVSELYITTTAKKNRVGYFPGGPPPDFMAEINY